MRQATVAYVLGDRLYLNITNRCTNACAFCIRGTKEGVGYNLWLEEEPTADEVLQAIKNPLQYREIVFCGYGEPLLRPGVVRQVAAALKKQGPVSIRINTNGLANLYHRHNVLPELTGLIDVLSISLNAPDAVSYQQICRPQWAEEAYPALLGFIRESKKYIPRVVVSAVEWPGVDLEKCRAVAADLGVAYRIRKLTGSF